MPARYKPIWVTWERQRRNRTLSRSLDIDLVELDYRNPRLVRYLRATMSTLLIFWRRKPTLIVVACPSFVLASLVVAYGRLFRIPVVIDAHNGALRPISGLLNRPLIRLARLLITNATITIVSNDGLTSLVAEFGGRPFVLPDPVPEFKTRNQKRLDGRNNVFFVCTYAFDEPYMEVIEAARALGPDTVVYISGNPGKQRASLLAAGPANVIFTGYLPESEYVALLHSVDVVIDLTTEVECLVCGAYEALAAGKPMVLSDNSASRSYFNTGVCYTDNSAADIARAIRSAVANRHALETSVKGLCGVRTEEGRIQRLRLGHLLREMSARGGPMPAASVKVGG